MQFDQLGPYKIGRKLGRGGMGTVFEGVLADTGDRAAIKVLSAALSHDDGFRERFKTEIETLRKLNHPNIVRLFGFGEQGEYLFYSMELVEGRSLEDELQDGRKFTWPEVTEFAIQTCRALKHAHDRGVIHRDLKPANLLLTPSGEIKLSDFGIAKLFGAANLTSVGGVLGTAEYMAPEQTDGRTITPRCDLYSLGGVLYTLLAGRPPFKAPTLLEMIQLQRFAEPDPVGRYAADVPQELQQIVAELLIKDPERRIATAMVLSRRLEAMRHGLSMQGGQVSPSAPTNRGPLDAPVSSVTLTAPGGALPPLEREKSSPPEERSNEYAVAPAVSPSNKTEAARHERALCATVDLKSLEAEAKEPREAEPALSRRETDGASKFFRVTEEDQRRRELPRVKEPERWRHLQAGLLAAAVLGLAATGWYLMRPPSADTLFARISKAADSGDAQSLVAAQSEIEKFLAHYADDPRAEAVRGYEETVSLYWANRRAEQRARTAAGIEGASPIERAYLEATNLARVDPEGAVRRLLAIVDLYGGAAGVAPSDVETLALVRQQLERLQSQIERNTEVCLRMLNERLDSADKLEDAAAARAIREAIITLYGDKSWATPAVVRAREALAEMPPNLAAP